MPANILNGTLAATSTILSNFTATSFVAAGDVVTNPTSAQLIGGICLVAVNAKAFNLPATQTLRAALPLNLSVGDSFLFTVANSGAGASTVTAGDASTTVVNNPGVLTNAFGTFRVVCTAVGTYTSSTNTYTGSTFSVYRVG